MPALDAPTTPRTEQTAPESEAARMASRLRLLYTVTAPSAEPLDVRINRALALTTTLLGLDLGVLSRVEGDVFTVVASHTTGRDVRPGGTYPLGETYCSITLASDDVFAVADMGRSEHRDHICYSLAGLESYIGVAVRVRGEVYGTLCFSGQAPARAPFGEADSDLLRVLAGWVSGALEQQEQERALAEQAALVSGLYDASPLMMGVVELVGGGADILHRSDNAAAAAFFGTTPEAMRDRLASEIGFTPEVVAVWAEAYRRAAAEQRAVRFEGDVERPGGPHVLAATVSLVAQADPVLDLPDRFCYVVEDVTDQRAAQRGLAESERRTRVLSEATFEGIAFTRDGIVLDANAQFAQLFGYAGPADALGVQAAAFVAAEHAARVREMSSENRAEAYEVEAVRRDGSRFWAEVQGRTLPYSDGAPARVTAVRDVSRRREAEEHVRFQADVLAHVSDAVVALDLDGCVTYWNAEAERLHGLPAGAVLGRPFLTVVRYHVPPADVDAPPADAVAAPDARDALREAAGGLGDLFYEAPDGRRRVVSVSASLLLAEDGTERGVLAVLRDVTAEREMAARMRHQALHDGLTGLPNRTRFRHRVEHAMYTRAPFAVLYVDLDRFKGVNDTLGHDAGDQLLLAVAARMRTAVGPDGTVARLGGDEFAALVPGDARAARRAARRVLAALADPVGVGPGTVVPTASVGVVVRAERYDDPAALLRDADTAMYEAKRAGRNRVSVFDAAMHEAARQRFGLGHDLREAVRTATDTPAASPFQLRFQPIVDLATGEVAGFESLVRWEHPALGLLGPSRFIPLAEEIGLVADIDGLVLEATCREVGSWGSPDGRAACEGLAMVSVNCSDQSLLRPGLAARARDAADAAGLPPGCLTLELTERALVDTDAALAAVHEIRAHGLQLCVDDFGSGYSSLGLLHRLPVDGLKVDRSFVADLDTSPAAQAVVRAVVQFSTDLGLRTVAEGIETPAQLRRLREAGCRYGQGFLFAPPVAPDVARAMLAEAPWAGRWPL